MKTTSLIMAAGIGSRFVMGIKQFESVDDAGHIIMDLLISKCLFWLKTVVIISKHYINYNRRIILYIMNH